MKIKEIIETLQCAKAEVEWNYPLDYAVAIDGAVSILEKEVAKEPIYEGDGYVSDGSFVWYTWRCPKCNACYERDYEIYDYCPKCGQHIDWGYEE